MIKRSATIIKLPIDNESLINFPENIILDFGQKGTLDIGALCYLTRNNKFNRRKRYTTRPVDLSSYCEERAHNIQKLILDTSKSIQFSEISASKAHYQIQTGLIPFINWIDEHGHHKSFYSEVSARPVFREYNLFVLRRISKGEINSTTASAQIRSLLSILNQHLNIENLHEGANIPRKKIAKQIQQNQSKKLRKQDFSAYAKHYLMGLVILLSTTTHTLSHFTPPSTSPSTTTPCGYVQKADGLRALPLQNKPAMNFSRITFPKRPFIWTEIL